MSLPEVVYVYEDEGSDGDKYLVASRDPGDQEEGIVGVYLLEETLKIRHETQVQRKGTKKWFPPTK